MRVACLIPKSAQKCFYVWHCRLFEMNKFCQLKWTSTDIPCWVHREQWTLHRDPVNLSVNDSPSISQTLDFPTIFASLLQTFVIFLYAPCDIIPPWSSVSSHTVSSIVWVFDSIEISSTPSLSILKLNNTNSHFLILIVQATQAKPQASPAQRKWARPFEGNGSLKLRTREDWLNNYESTKQRVFMFRAIALHVAFRLFN